MPRLDYIKVTMGSVLSIFTLVALAAEEPTLLPGSAANGKKIYEAKCVACHVSLIGGDGTAIHTRPNRRIKTSEGLLAQVQACNQQLKSGLNKDQINDVVAYLYRSFYTAKKE